MERRMLLLGSAALLCARPLFAKAEPVRRTEGPRVLVVYFSRLRDMPPGADAVSHATASVGNTAEAARGIAQATGGALHEITVQRSYPVGHAENSAVAREERDADARPKLLGPGVDLKDYDVVFIGHPVWWYQEPMAVRSFVEVHDWSGKVVVPFCTSMGVGVENARENLRRLCRGARVEVGRRFAAGSAGLEAQAGAWAAEVMQQLTQRGVEK